MPATGMAHIAHFAKPARIDSSGSLLRVIANPSDYQAKPHSVWLPATSNCTSPALLRRIVFSGLHKLGVPTDRTDSIEELVEFRIEVSDDLSALVGNHARFVQAPSLPSLAEGAECPCRHGRLAAFYDDSVGHVLCHSMAPLADLHPLLAQCDNGDLGLNFRPIPTINTGCAARKLVDGLLQVLPELPPEARVDAETVAQLYPYLVSDLKSLRRPARVRKSFSWTPHMTHVADTIGDMCLITCLDKVPRAVCFVCAHYAADIIRERLHSDSFRPLVDEDVKAIFDGLLQLYSQMNLPQAIMEYGEARWAYLYCTLKRHKCMSHSPREPHDCKLAWRFISNCSKGMVSYPLGLLVSAVFTACKDKVDAHRDSQQLECYEQTGCQVRFRFSISQWSVIPLNLPATVSRRYIFVTGDVKKAFENIPLDGPDALRLAIDAYLDEAYSFTGMHLYVPLDSEGLVSGKAQFAQRKPRAFGKHARWLEVGLELAQELAAHYALITVIRVGEHTVLQTVGVPMGGPPCAQYLDVYLDHYEHLLMLRVWDSLLSGCSFARRHALHVIKLMQYFYRYADDLLALTLPDFCRVLMDPAKPRGHDHMQWLYPLCDDKGVAILDFEAEVAEQLPSGGLRGYFLCLALSLVPCDQENVWAVHYCPHNVRWGFGFEYPSLTQHCSWTAESVVRGALATMGPYAILGSSYLEGARGFLLHVLRRLVNNGYPKAALLKMWEQAWPTLSELPCRSSLHCDLPALYSSVCLDIHSLYKRSGHGYR